MGLRDIANADMTRILEDTETGFGWAISVIDPDENIAAMKGLSSDISQVIDPDTGQAVSGRLASVALSISSLETAGLGIPQGISDATKKPWLIEFEDISGNPFTFKVSQSNPDRAIGLVTCILEFYD